MKQSAVMAAIIRELLHEYAQGYEYPEKMEEAFDMQISDITDRLVNAGISYAVAKALATLHVLYTQLSRQVEGELGVNDSLF